MIEYEAMCGQGSYQLFQYFPFSQLSQKIDWLRKNGVLVWQLM